MARVQGRGHGRPQVHIAQAHHEVAGVEHDVVDRLQVRQPVDAADEFDVAGTPGRVRAHRLHVFVDRKPGGRVVPGQRQPHGAAGHLHIGCRVQACVGLDQCVHQCRQGQLLQVVVHLQRADTWSQVDHARQSATVAPGLQACHQCMYLEAQGQVQRGVAQFHQHVGIARPADHHRHATRAGRLLEQHGGEGGGIGRGQKRQMRQMRQNCGDRLQAGRRQRSVLGPSQRLGTCSSPAA